MRENIKELVISERKFLHELITEITILHGNLTLIQNKFNENENKDEAALGRMNSSVETIFKMIEMIKVRRSKIIKMIDKLEKESANLE